MIDREHAERFAAEWIAAWNARDLARILAHYADTIVFHSPRIAVVMGEPITAVAGKEGLARYWSKALAQSTDLHFDFDRLYVSSDGLTIAYRNQRGQHVTETFVFDAAGLAIESVAAYA